MYGRIGFMDFSQVIKDALRPELIRFEIALRKSVENDNRWISAIINHVLSAEGKRIRPMLVFLTAKSCGGVTPATYYGAVTIELLHTASLIHDDILDESSIRRGQPSVNAVFGNHQAVLSGDYLLSTALRESVKTGNLEIVDIISHLGQNLTEGELSQFAIANEAIIDEDEYFNVIDKKTASLLAACAKIGALTSGADRDTVNNFERFGRILGITFQLKDDIFDYYSQDVGKPTGSDIKEGKITLPLIFALQNAPRSDADEMLEIIRSRTYSDANVATLLQFAKTYGGIDYTNQKIDALLAEADSILESLSLNEDYRPLLQLLFKYLKERSY